MESARVFAFLSDEIGKYYDTHPKDEKYPRKVAIYRPYVVGALYTSVAFLEAAINEVFLDAEYCARPSKRHLGTKIVPRGAVEGVSPKIIELMGDMWLQKQKYHSWPGRSHLKKYLNKNKHGDNIQYHWSTFDKYQLALALNKKRPIGKSNRARKRVFLLTDFRNYLTHAKTEWVVTRAIKSKSKRNVFGTPKPEKQETVKLERRIKALIRSDENRPREGYPHEDSLPIHYFPYNCLTANFAKVAVKSSLEFHNEFSKRMDVKDIETREPILRGTLSKISSL
jgi:hypothetical protein